MTLDEQEEALIMKAMDSTRLHNLNELSASQNFLIMLRTLNTSDLTFTYMLFDPPVVQDLARGARDMLEVEIKENCHHLSQVEIDEFNGYLTTMMTYWGNR